MKNMEKITRQINSKKDRLEKVLNSNAPIIVSLMEAHERKIAHAELFLSELTEVTEFWDAETNLHLVPLSMLETQTAKADFASVEFEGKFCKLILVQNYPYGDLWLLYVASVESI